MYEIGKLLGTIIGGLGLFSLVRWLVQKAVGLVSNRSTIERNYEPERSYSPSVGQIESYNELSKKVDWLINQQMMEHRRISEQPIEVYPYYYPHR